MAGCYYFDVKPNLKLSRTNIRPQGKGSILLEKSHRVEASTIPSFTKDTPFGHEIFNWLQNFSKSIAKQILLGTVHYLLRVRDRCFRVRDKDFF